MKEKSKSIFGLRKDQYPFDFQKYLTLRNLLIFIVLVLSYLTFQQYAQAFILMIIFYPISVFTVKTTKYLRGMGIETVTAFTIFLSIVYGWKIAIIFGGILGTYIWAQAGLNQFTIVQCAMNFVAAFLGEWVASWNMQFIWTYVVACMIRNVATFVAFVPIQPNPVKNFTHLFSDIVWNSLMLPTLMAMLYNLIMAISV